MLAYIYRQRKDLQEAFPDPESKTKDDAGKYRGGFYSDIIMRNKTLFHGS